MSDPMRRLIGAILLIVAVGVASGQALLASCSPAVGANGVDNAGGR